MANINFPSTINQPTDGSFSHTAAGITWSWDGTTWKCQGINLAYVLPTASATTLGGVKVGSNLSISASGVLSATSSASNLNDLGDVSTVGVSSGQVLKYNGSSWAPAADATGVQSAAPKIEWTLTANGSSDYIFAGDGFPSPANDPTLYLMRGQTYVFKNRSGGHPFRIQSTVAQAGGGTEYNSGVTGQNASGANNEDLTFVVPMDAPATLYYQCTAHVNMNGTIYVLDESGGGASGLESRATAQAIANNVANNASSNITITAAKTYALHAIQTSHAAWVTLYTDTASRTNDANRNETTDPLPGAGVIAEIITSDGAKQRITPGTIGYNDDGTPSTNAYIKVVNKSGSTANITVTLYFVKLEV
tara:strand:+ start:6067 stop:7155 length:1089 start_codon:yes stop_codon:yes gene_type:complete